MSRRTLLLVLLVLLVTPGRARASITIGFATVATRGSPTIAPPALAPRLTEGSVERLERLWSTRLDGAVIGSPLYVRGLDIGGRRSDVLYGVTEGGSVYALRRITGGVIWRRQLGTLTACGSQFGITSTPVIDRSAQTLYAIGASGGLHALDLTTGAERGGWPVTLLAYPDAEHVWGGLALADGRIYVPVASYCDEPTADGTFADGRLIAVDASQRRIVSTFDVVPGVGNFGGIWGYGGASVDPQDGSIWTATGNSWVFDPACGCVDEGAGFAESIVRLTPDLTPVDANRPLGLPSPIVEDTDFGSTPLLFQPDGCPPLAAAHAKDGMLYVWLRSALAGGPIWQARIGPTDLDNPFIGEPSWSQRRSSRARRIPLPSSPTARSSSGTAREH